MKIRAILLLVIFPWLTNSFGQSKLDTILLKFSKLDDKNLQTTIPKDIKDKLVHYLKNGDYYLQKEEKIHDNGKTLEVHVWTLESIKLFYKIDDDGFRIGTLGDKFVIYDKKKHKFIGISELE